MDHDVPSQSSTRVPVLLPSELPPLPTAVHQSAPTHDTAESDADGVAGSGLETADQVTPFHCSIRVPVGTGPWVPDPSAISREPTAKHADGPEHEMPVNAERVPGTSRTDQPTPFQRSESGRREPGGPALEPTAMQSVVDGQLTADSEGPVPGAFGEGTIDHLVPSQSSVSVDPNEKPTAMQNDEPMHETPPRLLSIVPGGFGLAMVDQMGAVRPDAEAGPAPLPITPASKDSPPSSTTTRARFICTAPIMKIMRLSG